MSDKPIHLSPFLDMSLFTPWKNLQELFNDFRPLPPLGSIDDKPRMKMNMHKTDSAYPVKAEARGDL